jgi:hypothetical protein
MPAPALPCAWSTPSGCLGLALLRGLSLAASGSPTAEASCQTSTAGQLDGLSRKLMLLEDSYLGKVGVSTQLLQSGYATGPAASKGSRHGRVSRCV